MDLHCVDEMSGRRHNLSLLDLALIGGTPAHVLQLLQVLFLHFFLPGCGIYFSEISVQIHLSP